jgi:hypothetical protein
MEQVTRAGKKTDIDRTNLKMCPFYGENTLRVQKEPSVTKSLPTI